ncbi:uncharacterized protein LOC124304447 [Neodiprion virginianus]|uniref:uncharacterized protein LOC124304447 n=1 Tax=Neodiprion virginianus TaxID=2961670 RepID=UPI001EE6DD70|nr:uncharacterized protein LOC124304447 [Neodiprion virginianus]
MEVVELDEEEDEEVEENNVDEKDEDLCSLRAVLHTIQEILDKGDEMIVVSQWTSMLEVVRSRLKTLNGATYDTLSGKIPVKNRIRALQNRKLEIANGGLTGAGTAGASKLLMNDLKCLFSL